MKPQKEILCFRCITDPVKGYGNFARALLLAEEMKKRNFSIFFIIEKNITAQKLLSQKKIPFYTLSLFKSKILESRKILSILQKNNGHTIILDMREQGELLSKHLVKDIFVILIDDAWGNNAYADMIFNGTMIKKYHNYKIKNPTSRIYTGTKYWLSDNNFVTYQKKNQDISNSQQFILTISMGGSDPDDLTFFVYKAITNLPNIKIRIIVGPFFKKIQQLKKEIKTSKNIRVIVNPKEIWNEFNKSDLVISNAGSTLFELVIMRIPTICISVVDHQILYAKFFHNIGATKYLGFKNLIDEEKIRLSIINLLKNKSERKKMFVACKTLIDGKGLFRVSSIIEKTIN